MQLAAEGHNNSEIGRKLGINESTARYILKRWGHVPIPSAGEAERSLSDKPRVGRPTEFTERCASGLLVALVSWVTSLTGTKGLLWDWLACTLSGRARKLWQCNIVGYWMPFPDVPREQWLRCVIWNVLFLPTPGSAYTGPPKSQSRNSATVDPRCRTFPMLGCTQTPINQRPYIQED
jgi:hypothetical protein